jgi:hypothetical protein
MLWQIPVTTRYTDLHPPIQSPPPSIERVRPGSPGATVAGCDAICSGYLPSSKTDLDDTRGAVRKHGVQIARDFGLAISR